MYVVKTILFLFVKVKVGRRQMWKKSNMKFFFIQNKFKLAVCEAECYRMHAFYEVEKKLRCRLWAASVRKMGEEDYQKSEI